MTGKDMVGFFLDVSEESCDWDRLSAFLKRKKKPLIVPYKVRRGEFKSQTINTERPKS